MARDSFSVKVGDRIRVEMNDGNSDAGVVDRVDKGGFWFTTGRRVHYHRVSNIRWESPFDSHAQEGAQR